MLSATLLWGDINVLFIEHIDSLSRGAHRLLLFELVQVLADEKDQTGEDEDHDGNDNEDDCQNTVKLLLFFCISAFWINDHQLWILFIDFLSHSDITLLSNRVLRGV